VLLHRIEVFLRIECRCAFRKHVERIGSDDVELLVGSAEIVARVVVVDGGPGIEHDAIIFLPEELRRDGWNARLDFANLDLLNVGVARESAGRHARTEADAQHRFRLGMHQSGQMAHHPLQPHVVWFVGGFHVAVDIDLHRAVFPLRNYNGGVAAFRLGQQGGVSNGSRDLSTEGD